MHMADQPSPRRAARVTISAEIDFRRAGDHRYRVTLLDFSPEGCRIETPIRVEQGDLIWISLPKMESIPGRICWVRDWTAGVEFDRPLYPSVFSMLCERLGSNDLL